MIIEGFLLVKYCYMSPNCGLGLTSRIFPKFWIYVIIINERTIVLICSNFKRSECRFPTYLKEDRFPTTTTTSMPKATLTFCLMYYLLIMIRRYIMTFFLMYYLLIMIRRYIRYYNLKVSTNLGLWMISPNI